MNRSFVFIRFITAPTVSRSACALKTAFQVGAMLAADCGKQLAFINIYIARTITRHIKFLILADFTFTVGTINFVANRTGATYTIRISHMRALGIVGCNGS